MTIMRQTYTWQTIAIWRPTGMPGGEWSPIPHSYLQPGYRAWLTSSPGVVDYRYEGIFDAAKELFVLNTKKIDIVQPASGEYGYQFMVGKISGSRIVMGSLATEVKMNGETGETRNDRGESIRTQKPHVYVLYS